MRVEKASFGYLVLLMPEEQKEAAVIEKIAALKEAGKVAVFISGSENTSEFFSRLIRKNIEK